jgi:flavin reductase (DIM6/NTAB) family NADH-FMN oxidoreductase RutF
MAIADDPEVERFGSLVSALHYPMFIVTANDGTRRAGCLVGFAGQCGIDPPRFMVWLSKRNHTHRVALHSERLAVHLPTARQRELAVLFGSVTGFAEDKFARCRWRPGPGDVPLLSDCPQWFVGQVLHRYDTGDHLGVLLEPTHVSDDVELGQLDFQEVREVEPGNDP